MKLSIELIIKIRYWVLKLGIGLYNMIYFIKNFINIINMLMHILLYILLYTLLYIHLCTYTYNF